MVVHTLGMANSQRVWFEGNLRGVTVELRQFGEIAEFAATLEDELPGMVVVADPPYSEEEVRRILGDKDVMIVKCLRAAASLDQGSSPPGSAAAVMPGYDQRSPIDDTEPPRKRPN
jgi:hypothetical protein